MGDENYLWTLSLFLSQKHSKIYKPQINELSNIVHNKTYKTFI